MTGSEPAPEVSVIIPTHRRCVLLQRLLASLAAQTLEPHRYEVLVVHNHTDDGTEPMAQAWCAAQAFGARYFRQQFNGPTRSRAFGASMARGRVLAFIDDDCVASPGWLAAGLAAFTTGKGLVQGRTLPQPAPGLRFPIKTVEVTGPTAFFETCNIFYRREVFDAVGGFSSDFMERFYGEDTDLGWKVVEAGHGTAFAADALVHHEVFNVTVRQWLAEPAHFVNIPYLVRKHPGLRKHLYLNWFASRDIFLFNLLLLAALLALAGARWSAAALALPYVVERYRNGAHAGGPAPRLARLLMGVPRHAVAWWALLRGSLRARTLLL